ncbi:hemolysin [Inquilinus limosus]|uniref:hypothetical protein n=1 Tax=Inquilinus limosus TaxID=171674 RepID=UPI003F14C232
MAIINGTPGDDVFSGTNGNDTIIGNGGDDLLHGGGGSDRLEGGVGSDSLYGDAGDDILHDASTGDDLNELLDGGDGTDTADYSSHGQHILLDIELGVGGLTGGVILVSIENLIGTKFDNDMLFGNAGNNVIDGLAGADLLHGGGGDDVLRGGAGADSLNGGDGIDTASYYDSSAGVIVDLTLGTSGSGGDAQGDDLVRIENVNGSQWNDTLGGDAGANVLAGLGGNDVLRGGRGADRLDGGVGSDTASYYASATGVAVDLAVGTGMDGDAQGDVLVSIENVDGGQGNDTLAGTIGANILAGWGGDDVLRGGAGADRLDGGIGRDTASYLTSAGGVTADLSSGTGTGGDAQGDTLIGIENVTGSQGNDRLTGDDGSNVLAGLGGNDVLRGGAGADQLDGGLGIDTVSYFEGTVGVSVSLITGQGSGGNAQGDVLTGVENISGSQGDDVLAGDASANTLQGWNGNDVLRGGAGADAMDGGAGIDTVSYFDSSIAISVSLITGLGGGGAAAGDALSGIENLSGSQGNDGLAGDAGANTLQGWNGNDALVGGAGRDILTGGAGADRYHFTALSDSVVGANADLITDFSQAQVDRIDLHLIDANTGVAGDQAFVFIGSGLYTGVAGQLRYATSSGATTIAGDVDGDGASDFHIQLTGAIGLVAIDFVL